MNSAITQKNIKLKRAYERNLSRPGHLRKGFQDLLFGIGPKLPSFRHEAAELNKRRRRRRS